MRGIGAESRQTEAFSKTEEEKLWDSGVLGSNNPNSLLRDVFYLNGRNFCLRGGEEQRNLRISQFKRLQNPDRYVYTENASKNRTGGLKQISVKNKSVPIWESLSCILDTYLGKLSTETLAFLGPACGMARLTSHIPKIPAKNACGYSSLPLPHRIL